MAGIERVAVGEERLGEMWGISAYDYRLNNQQVDLQDLLVQITQQRATAIEDEVKPLQTIINRRNARLEKYGAVLQVLTTIQAQFTEDKTEASAGIGSIIPPLDNEAEFWSVMHDIGYDVNGSGGSITLSKSECEGYVSRCKSKVDEMNNDAQRDMTRLQSVVDRRDESYSTATSLMTAVSDSRSTLIKNL